MTSSWVIWPFLVVFGVPALGAVILWLAEKYGQSAADRTSGPAPITASTDHRTSGRPPPSQPTTCPGCGGPIRLLAAPEWWCAGSKREYVDEVNKHLLLDVPSCGYHSSDNASDVCPDCQGAVKRVDAGRYVCLGGKVFIRGRMVDRPRCGWSGAASDFGHTWV